MVKKILRNTLLMILSLVVISHIAPMCVQADGGSDYDWIANGLALKYVDKTARTCKIVGCMQGATFSGTLDLRGFCDEYGGSAYDVVEIPEAAFLNQSEITEVLFSSKLTTLGMGAFQNCIKLQNINWNNCEITNIPQQAFCGCTSLNKAVIPAYVKIIGINAYAESGISSLGFMGTKVQVIYENAFRRCNNLTSIVIPASVGRIDGGAFAECTALNNVSFAGGSILTSLGSPVFLNSDNIKTIDFGKNSKLTSIGEQAFAGRTALESITIPASVTNIGSAAFGWCEGLKNITFEDGSNLASLSNMAFGYSNNIETINFGANSKLTSIPDLTFFNCGALKSINIPPNINSIGYAIFANDFNLKYILFPSKKSDAVYNNEAFGYCGISHFHTTEEAYNGNLKSVIGAGAFKKIKIDAQAVSGVPSGLKAIDNGNKTFSLSWSGMNNVEYYSIQRSTNGGTTWTTIGTVKTTSYNDQVNVTDTSKLKYRVAGVNLATVDCDDANDPFKGIEFNRKTGSYTEVGVTNNKETPNVTVPTLGAITYNPGNKLREISIPTTGVDTPGAWSWNEPETIPTVNVKKYKATFTPQDGTKYNSVTKDVPLTVNPATPDVKAPTLNPVEYAPNRKLSSVSLGDSTGNIPGTWEWQNSDTPIGNAQTETKTFPARFNPTDNVNYNSVTKNINLKVEKADPGVKVPTLSEITYDPSKKLNSISLEKSKEDIDGTWTWSAPDTTPPIGTNTYEIIFTPVDNTNYNQVRTHTTLTVNEKEIPNVADPKIDPITYSPGKKLKAISIPTTDGDTPGAWAWKEPDTNPTVNVKKYKATFTPQDTKIFATVDRET